MLQANARQSLEKIESYVGFCVLRGSLRDSSCYHKISTKGCYLIRSHETVSDQALD